MWSLSGRPTSGTGRGNSKSARGQITAEDTCLSGVHRLEIVYILCVSSRVFHGSLPSCTLLGRIKRTHNNRSTLGSQGRPHRPKSRPVSVCVAGLGPRWGNGPVPARSGAIWAPQGPVWQKEKKPPPLPVGGKFGGVILKQVKGCGSVNRPHPDHLARQSRSLWAFCPLPPPKQSGVGWEALGLRPGSETRNFPVASHFCGCHRRGQRKDEEKHGR